MFKFAFYIHREKIDVVKWEKDVNFIKL